MAMVRWAEVAGVVLNGVASTVVLARWIEPVPRPPKIPPPFSPAPFVVTCELVTFSCTPCGRCGEARQQ